ncbi:uncharacterized protein [Heptranchias perlo]|uniref:uncharacterized protein n=1 Tax=Heptranchias perlo TaxID=212740 RepID=UPI003559937A
MIGLALTEGDDDDLDEWNRRSHVVPQAPAAPPPYVNIYSPAAPVPAVQTPVPTPQIPAAPVPPSPTITVRVNTPPTIQAGNQQTGPRYTSPVSSRTRSKNKKPLAPPSNTPTSPSSLRKRSNQRQMIQGQRLESQDLSDTDSEDLGDDLSSLDSEPGTETPARYKSTPRQLPVRQMPNPAFNAANPVGAGNAQTIDVYYPWKPNEIMAILTGMPDRKKSPTSFVDFLWTTILVYNAESRDLWALVQQVLTPAEHARFLANLQFADHAALANHHAQNDARERAILTALTTTLQKPIDISKVLDTKPKRGEGAEEFLERFSEVYRSQSGDANYRNGANSPQYCAILINCLPTQVSEAIKTNNMDWSDNSPSQMARAVKYYWKESKNQESQPQVKIKAEYVMKKEEQKPTPDGVEYQMEPQYCVPGWVDGQGYGYVRHPNGPTAPNYGPPYAPLRHSFDGRRGGGRQAGSGTCFNCGQQGHWSKECPSRRQGRRGHMQGQQRGGWQGNRGRGRYTDFSQNDPFPQY